MVIMKLKGHKGRMQQRLQVTTMMMNRRREIVMGAVVKQGVRATKTEM